MIQGSGLQALPPPQWDTTLSLTIPSSLFQCLQLPVWLPPTVWQLHTHAVVGESYTVILQPIQLFTCMQQRHKCPIIERMGRN